jgi:crotonobetainyl-CoA:carnitine CoA-transferase CaiB-like acyl-CoA transferase
MIKWLSGVTVVDLTANVAGPFCTLVLKDLGARVIKLEGVEGDSVRRWPPFADGVSTTFMALNRGKESLALDLKNPRGAEVARRLLARSDVFVESLRPGAAARLGLGSDQLRQANPGLVYLSLNAFGSIGPLAGEPGFDAIIQAYSGIMDVTGYPGEPPARVGTGIVDFGTGLWAALSVIGALLQRSQTGQGCHLESTLLGTASSFMMHHIASASLGGVVPGRIGTAQHNTAPYEAVQAKDGMIMLGVANDGLWLRLLDVIDDGRLRGDPRFRSNPDRVRHRNEIVRLIGELLADRSKEDVVRELAANGIPAAVIRSVDALADDPQVEALRLMGRTESGTALPVTPVRCDGEVAELDADAPVLGDATATLLEECGYSPTDIADLVGQQVAFAAVPAR